jgi:hypothetical protein
MGDHSVTRTALALTLAPRVHLLDHRLQEVGEHGRAALARVGRDVLEGVRVRVRARVRVRVMVTARARVRVRV